MAASALEALVLVLAEEAPALAVVAALAWVWALALEVWVLAPEVWALALVLGSAQLGMQLERHQVCN